MTMDQLIWQFPDHAEASWKQANDTIKTLTLPDRSDIRSVLITGLGGSAIGGDVLKSYVADTAKVPVVVNRHYNMPSWVDHTTMVITSSYSGNTEETLSAYDQAKAAGAMIVSVSSGGELTERCRKDGYPVIPLEGGLPPRAAFGHSFFALLAVACSTILETDPTGQVIKCIASLRLMRDRWKNMESETGDMAKWFKDSLPVVYSGCEEMEPINTRWRGQIAENAEQLAYGNVFPELNHNEIVGWHVNPELFKKVRVLILRSPADHDRVKLRMDITRRIIEEAGGLVRELEFTDPSMLSRMMLALHYGDWVSYHLSQLNGVDPMPVKKIDRLKSELSKVKME